MKNLGRYSEDLSIPRKKDVEEKYTMPTGGIPKSDLSSSIQSSLEKAETALQTAPVTSVNGATGEVKSTFYVTVTQGSDDNVTADKTAEEVYAAYEAGYAVYAIVPSEELGAAALPLAIAFDDGTDKTMLFATTLFQDVGESPTCLVVFCISGAWLTQSMQLAKKAEIPTIPTALKNPNALNIKIGDTTTSYDGSAAKTVKIPEGGPTMRKVTLPVTGWNSSTKQQSVTVTGVLADGTKQRVICSPVDESYDSAWNSCYVQCVGHGADSLTFQCDEIPTAAIEVYVSIQPVSFAS